MEYASLAERIASLHEVKPEEVVLGCGSTEILRMAAFAFLGSGKQLIQASPMLARAGASTTLVYIRNPNNPTASLTPRKDLEAFISKLPSSTFVVIDEAYHHYAGQSGMYASFIDRPFHDERIIVVRTFSKVYGLAGLRLGYAVASANAIQQMRKFTTEDNINALVTQAAAATLDDSNGVDDSVQRNANDRQEFLNQAMAPALKPIDSHANLS